MLRFFAGLIALLALVAGVYLLEGGNLFTLLIFTAFIIELFVPLFASLAVWKAGDIGLAFRDALGREPGRDTVERSARIWAFYERLFYLAGLIGILLGVMFDLSNLRRDTADLAKSFALTLTVGVYAVFFGLIARVLRACVQRRAVK